jgi:hypothetical protein
MFETLHPQYIVLFQVIMETLGEEIDLNLLNRGDVDVKTENLTLKSLEVVLKFWLFKSTLEFEKKKALTECFALLFKMHMDTGKHSLFDILDLIEDSFSGSNQECGQARFLTQDLVTFIDNEELLEDDDVDLNGLD